MKLSVTTLGCPEWTLAQIIDRVHGYGYHGIDLRGLGDTLDVTLRPEFSTQIDRTRALLESHGLVVSGFSSSALCYADSVEKADASRAEVERYCVAAKALGTTYIRVFGGRFPSEMPVADAVAKAAPLATELADIAAGYGCVIVVETHDNWIDSSAARMLLETVDHPSCKALWDMNHPWRMNGESAERTMAQIGDWVAYTHIKDSAPTADGEFAYVPLGCGDVPVGDAVRLLARRGYDGWLVFEHEKRWIPSLPDPDVAFPQYAIAMRRILQEEGIRVG